MPATLGEGEHECPVLEAVLLGMRDLFMGLHEVKHTVIESCELERKRAPLCHPGDEVQRDLPDPLPGGERGRGSIEDT